MEIKLGLTRAQAAAAAGALIELIESQPTWGWNGDGRQAMPEAVAKALRELPPETVPDARGEAALDALPAQEVLSWVTTRDNAVALIREGETWCLSAATTRHAIHAGNGVGIVFGATFGYALEDAPKAPVLQFRSESDAPWWVCGVTPREGSRFYTS